MLSLGKVTGGDAGNAAYYVEAVAASAEDYYAGDGEAPGRWAGAGIGALGRVRGQVVTEVEGRELLDSLGVDGSTLGSRPYSRTVSVRRRDPHSGEVSLSERTEHPLTAHDLTFSAPKSVSALWALADGEQAGAAVAAHDTAVTAALTYLEGVACWSRRGKGGVESVPGEGFIALAYRHRTSRAMDPQLHTHLLVANRVQCEDGKWRAIDARPLFAEAKGAGMIYQAVLRAELTASLGVGWTEVDEHGQAEVDGVPDDLLDRWSKRSIESDVLVEEWVSDFVLREDRDPTSTEIRRMRQAATLHTRTAKGDVKLSDETLLGRWAADADSAGLGFASWARGLDAGEAVPVLTDEAAVAAVTSTLEARQAVWQRSDVVREAARLAGGGSSAEVTRQIGRVVTAVLGAGVELDGTEPGPGGLRCEYTTSLVLDHEWRVATWASGHVGADRALAREARRLGDHLGEDQATAVASLLGSTRRVGVLVGPAGTGKTTALRELVSAHERAGRPIIGLGPSKRAADELASSTGLATSTVELALRRLEGADTSRRLPEGGTVLVDEAGMLSARDFDRLAKAAAASRTRLVLVGDPNQLASVKSRGGLLGLFDALDTEHDLGWVSRLESVRRFADPEEAAASLALRRGDVGALGFYEQSGRVRGGDRAALVAGVAGQVLDDRAASTTALVMCDKQSDADQINTAVRAKLVASGDVDDGAARQYRAGLRLGPGDELLVRRNDYEITTSSGRAIANGDTFTVTEAQRDHVRVVSTQNPKESVQLPASYVAEHGQYAWASTVHRAQGATVDAGYYLSSGSGDRSQLYVGLTRGRLRNEAWVISEEIDTTSEGSTLGVRSVEAPGQVLARQAAREDLAGVSAIQRMLHHQDRVRSGPEPQPAEAADNWADLVDDDADPQTRERLARVQERRQRTPPPASPADQHPARQLERQRGVDEDLGLAHR
jgi:conjugative relaxase-like TrwC/TraI family protein